MRSTPLRVVEAIQACVELRQSKPMSPLLGMLAHEIAQQRLHFGFMSGAGIQLGEHQTQRHRVRQLLDRTQQQDFRLFRLALRFIDACENRHRIFVVGLYLNGTFRVLKPSGCILQLDPSRRAHGQQSDIVGVLREAGFDDFESAFRCAAEQEQAPQSNPCLQIVRIGVDGPLVELSSLARVAHLFIDYAVLVASFAVGGRDLQRVAQFHARFFEISFREEALALFQMFRLACFRTAASRHHDGGNAEHGQPQTDACCGGKSHGKLPSLRRGERV